MAYLNPYSGLLSAFIHISVFNLSLMYPECLNYLVSMAHLQ